MSQTYFSFKQFTIHHDKCAMKVGTDGVLLGAWVDVTSSKRILDIGAGTGLISLMLAQRSDAHIVGVEINQAASEQAKENVLKSPWSHRIDIVLSDINQYKPLQKFDTIVSNPPYFIDSLKCPDIQRNTARHTDTLSAESLLVVANELLLPDGKFSMIIPYEQTSQIIQKADKIGMYLTRHLTIFTRVGVPPKRSLLEFSKIKEICKNEELTIELERHVYTKEYIALTKDFYLKM